MMRLTSRTAFTLIELAVVLVIASLMVGFGLQTLQRTGTSNCYERTRVEMQDIQGAVERFVRTNNRYPKPARVDYGTSNPDFGVEASSGVTSTGGVLIGSVPTTSIGLATEYADDCWGSKYTYAVTSALTSTDAVTGYPASGVLGTITVNSGTIASPSAVSTAAAFVVVSHGEDKTGGTPMSAANITAQTCSIVATKTDSENCDFSNTSFYASDFNNNTGATGYYDDILLFADKASALPADCTSAVVSWCTAPTGANPCYVSGCSATTGTTIGHGANMLLNYTNTPTVPTTTGSVTVTCNNGTLSQSGATCGKNCASTASSWSGTAAGCSGAMTGAMTAGQVITGIANTAANRTGTGTATCDGVTGTVSFTGSTCTATCSASGAYSWNTNCSYTLGAPQTISGGGTLVLTNSAAGYTGSTTLNCNATTGAITQSGSSCAVSGGNCTAGTSVSWAGTAAGCSATLGSTLTSGSSTGVTNSAAGHTGSATASCNSGTLTGAGTCYNDCTAQTQSWNTNCSGSVTALTHGGSVSISNSAVGYTGSATFTCNNGSLSSSATSCTGRAPLCYERGSPGCAVDGEPCGTYYYTDGTTEVDAAPKDYSGTNPPDGWTICSSGTACDNGLEEDTGFCDASSCYNCCSGVSGTYPNWSGTPSALATGTCATTAIACSAGSHNWGSDLCGGTYGAMSSGGSTVMSNTVGEPSYTGSSTATCTNGTVTFGSESCAAASCSAPSCDGTGYLWGTPPACCAANGSFGTTSGFGCERLKCVNGVWVHQSYPGLCEEAAEPCSP